MRKSWWVLLGIALFVGGALAAHSEADAKKRPAAIKAHSQPQLKKSVAKATKPAQATRQTEVCRRNPSVPEGQIDIFERICAARELLNQQQAKMQLCEKKQKVCKGKGRKRQCQVIVTGHYLCGRSILLAAIDKANGKLAVIEIEDKEKKPSVPGYAIKRITYDGVDSEYEVVAPPGKVVVGIQYPLTLKTAQGLKQVRAVYVPYSRDLQESFPSLLRVGELYLRAIIAKVYEAVNEAGVDVSLISPDVLYNLVVVEHSNYKALVGGDVQGEMERVQMTLGANGGLAFKFAVSSAGARGLCQIMPRTYRSLQNRYPNLLRLEFYGGTANHFTAVTAQLLLAREDMKFLFSQPGWRGNKNRRDAFLADGKRVGEYLAVAYNGGGPRAARWESSDRSMILPAESAGYLVKFDKVWEYFHPTTPTTPKSVSRGKGVVAHK